MFLEDDKNNENNELEVIIGDDSNLEISDVGDLMTDLKPKTEKKTNIVIPVATSKKSSSTPVTNSNVNKEDLAISQTEPNKETMSNEENKSSNADVNYEEANSEDNKETAAKEDNTDSNSTNVDSDSDNVESDNENKEKSEAVIEDATDEVLSNSNDFENGSSSENSVNKTEENSDASNK